MHEAERGLHDLLVEHLTTDEQVDADVTGLVLAAWSGAEDLAETLAGRSTPAADPSTPADAPEPPEAYLAAVHVAGFRGIGEEYTLPLRPGPGLTLVTGRNGSGKSSFAEGAELALTGTSSRWHNRSSVIWREGWRNLHATGPTSVSVDLVTTGATGTTRVTRRWEPEAGLDDAVWTVQEPGAKRTGYDGGTWRQDMETYRPFLSYGELGALIDGKPSELHDALFRLLGLGPLSDAQDRLKAARKPLEDAARSVNSGRRDLRAALESVEDERASAAAALLKKTAPDLDAVAELATGSDDDTAVGERLRALQQVTLPAADDVAAAAARLRSARETHGRIATDEARSADETATLLRAALHHHDGHGDGSCPVCGSGALDAAWHDRAAARAGELEASAVALRTATRELDEARAAAAALVAPLPEPALSAPVDTDGLVAVWEAWTGAAGDPDALEAAHGPALAALESARKAVDAELAHRDEVWAPLARRLATWHDEAYAVQRDQPARHRLAAADAWLAGTAGTLRDQRLAPFAEASQHVWRTLRQQSNVELGPVRLDGKGNRRRVALDVSVDDAEGGTALGVMSQGELHALGLSLFLPRATVPESPFRFVMIDDPVQAMDPAKVDGLAALLSEVAQDRQVVVFSHDDRLADSVRRLGRPATILEVQRRERSAVEIHRNSDPVERYLKDAEVLAWAEEIPIAIRGEVVATSCRSAIEAACQDRIRRTRLARGVPHADVEAALADARTTHQLATLAVFDDAGRGSDLLGRLNAGAGRAATDAFQKCRAGAHTGISVPLRDFLRDVRRLVGWLRR
ncbi:AAA family ATPase [Pseudonocardia nematodicida]|uniref:Nuclease SbcCD subunit C n=1 Tax=Pseudonocardia nematodicida TaxID=1206997 RepID=A0ABV1KJM1_9PSEU